jgi:hypothetical protein
VRPTSIPVIYFLPFLRGGGGGILSDVSQVQAVRALFRFLLLSLATVERAAIPRAT